MQIDRHTDSLFENMKYCSCEFVSMYLFVLRTALCSQSRDVDRDDKKAVKEANMYYFIESGMLNHQHHSDIVQHSIIFHIISSIVLTKFTITAFCWSSPEWSRAQQDKAEQSREEQSGEEQSRTEWSGTQQSTAEMQRRGEQSRVE